MTQLLTFFALYLLFSVSKAIPLSLVQRDVSTSLLNQLAFIEQYAAAAYCPDNNIPGSSSTITCDPGYCPLVQSAGATSLAEFQNVGLTDATGFVAVDHANHYIVISFRGSKSVGSWVSNLNLVMVNWSVCKGCMVHAGFLDSWNGVRGNIKQTLASAVKSWPSYTIIATGHSLGASMATLAAGELRSQGYKITLYTYGSPMTGNVFFANFVTQQGNNFRVTHNQDIIPKLPGYLLGYAHVSSEYWITSGSGVTPSTNSIKVSSGAINFSGNEGTWGSSVSDHLYYFNHISGCGADDLDLSL